MADSLGDLALGERLHARVRDLYPLCRSITGEGLRETLRRVQSAIPIEIREVPTGTPVLDWEVPREWSIRGARIEALDGRVLVDFRDHNLHVMSYSAPVDRVVSREELAGHVHTLPAQPTLIPYRTGYYADTWAFCLPHDTWEGMRDEAYRVVVDSELKAGSVSYGELLVPGETEDEVLISVHSCHPSLANDNLSGLTVAVELAQRQMRRPGRLGVRFLFVPGTIGAITWLASNEEAVARVRHGLVLTCIGDRGHFHYKRSRRGDAIVDRAVARVLADRGAAHELMPFTPFGYDERQYGSPGFDLPVGCFMRSPNGSFPEYHTSADDPDFVAPEALAESYAVLAEILDVLDADRLYRRVDGRGEPQLGRRGLYRAISGQEQAGGATQAALTWVLNLADGRHSLLDICDRAGLPFREVRAAAQVALDFDLVRSGP